MSGSRFVLPFQAVFDPSYGIPGCKLYFYASGTSNALDTYSNAALSIANPNPVQADGGGLFGNIFMLPQAYKVILTDSLGNQIWSADPVYAPGGGGTIMELALRTVTGNTTVLASDGILQVDATTGPKTVTFPRVLGSAVATQVVSIVKIDNSNNAVNIISDAGATVLYNLNFPNQAIDVYSDGANLHFK